MSSEDICEEIEDILISLTDEGLKVDAYTIEGLNEDYIKVTIVDNQNTGFDFNVENFADEFKQLFSFVESEGWTPMGENEDMISETPGGNKIKNDASFVDVLDMDIVCPNCGSDEISSSSDEDDEDDEIEVCDNCEYSSHMSDFEVLKIKFGSLDKLLLLIQRSLDKIQICFKRK